MPIDAQGRTQVATLNTMRYWLKAGNWCYVREGVIESVALWCRVDGIYKIDGILKVG